LTRITVTLRENLGTCMIITRSFLLRKRKVSDKICRENRNTDFFFFKWCRLWDNVKKWGTAGQYNTEHALWMLAK